MLPPDSVKWRWELAVEAAKFPEPQAELMLRGADPLTRRVSRFKRSIDLGLYTERDPIHFAHEVWQRRPIIRRSIECLLLADESTDQEIAEFVGVSPELLPCYREVFFDVRDRMKSPGWILETVFTGEIYRQLARGDTDAMYFRIAYLSGRDAYHAYCEGHRAFGSEEERQAFMESLGRRIMSRQIPLIALMMSNGGEQGLEILKMVFTQTTNALKGSVPGSDKMVRQIQAQVELFISSNPLSVADPAAPSKFLGQDGREPRLLSTREVSDAPAHV